MSSSMEKLHEEKAELLKEYLQLKEEHQKLYYAHRKLMREHEKKDKEVLVLRKEVINLNGIITESKENKSVLKENRNLQAKLRQIKRYSTFEMTPKRISCKSKQQSNEFEVEQLLKHRGRKKNREFLVRWKHFGKNYDTWEKELNLKCPLILNEYLRKNKLAK